MNVNFVINYSVLRRICKCTDAFIQKNVLTNVMFVDERLNILANYIDTCAFTLANGRTSVQCVRRPLYNQDNWLYTCALTQERSLTSVLSKVAERVSPVPNNWKYIRVLIPARNHIIAIFVSGILAIITCWNCIVSNIMEQNVTNAPFVKRPLRAKRRWKPISNGMQTNCQRTRKQLRR